MIFPIPQSHYSVSNCTAFPIKQYKMDAVIKLEGLDIKLGYYMVWVSETSLLFYIIFIKYFLYKVLS